MSAERLQKVLARAGLGSRRRIEELIREGRVTVNGSIAELGERADLAVDAVKVDGQRIHASGGEHRYVLVNKPVGYVSTLKDPEGRQTVLDLVPQRLHKGLVPVGRLDFDSEGLLLLTDDGELANRIAHPRYGCNKTYEVKVKGRPSEAALDRLRGGVLIEGKMTAPAVIAPRSGAAGARSSVSNSWWRVVLSEGRTRQIREMFFRIGHPVSRLRRLAIGPVRAAGLPLGGWRELSEREVEQLRRLGEKKPGKKPEKGAPAARQAAAGKPAPRKRAPARAEASGEKAASAPRKPAAPRPTARQSGETASRGRRPSARPMGERPAGRKPPGPGRKPSEPGRKPAAPGRKPAGPGRKPEGTGRKPAAPGRKPTGPGRKPAARPPAGKKPAAKKPPGRSAGRPTGKRPTGKRPTGKKPTGRRPSPGGGRGRRRDG